MIYETDAGFRFLSRCFVSGIGRNGHKCDSIRILHPPFQSRLIVLTVLQLSDVCIGTMLGLKVRGGSRRCFKIEHTEIRHERRHCANQRKDE